MHYLPRSRINPCFSIHTNIKPALPFIQKIMKTILFFSFLFGLAMLMSACGPREVAASAASSATSAASASSKAAHQAEVTDADKLKCIIDHLRVGSDKYSYEFHSFRTSGLTNEELMTTFSLPSGKKFVATYIANADGMYVLQILDSAGDHYQEKGSWRDEGLKGRLQLAYADDDTTDEAIARRQKAFEEHRHAWDAKYSALLASLYGALLE